jgi:hypothetical protein
LGQLRDGTDQWSQHCCTTPTQAVLAYTAPPGVTCTLTVSEAPALTPVVHDVDPRLFHNANLDNRPGNISLGRRHVFVIGNRTADVALNGNRVSRALQVFTPHFFRINCGFRSRTRVVPASIPGRTCRIQTRVRK